MALAGCGWLERTLEAFFELPSTTCLVTACTYFCTLALLFLFLRPNVRSWITLS